MRAGINIIGSIGQNNLVHLNGFHMSTRGIVLHHKGMYLRLTAR